MCIRCRKESPSVFLVNRQNYVGYSLNFCQPCTIATLGESTTSLKGKGEAVWKANIDTPMHFYREIEQIACDPRRETDIAKRSKETRFHVLTGAKLRRNEERAEMVKQKALEYNVFKGEHLSWGFGAEFDEYYGTVDAQGRPSGLGVKFYSDGSVYIGEWLDGLQHTHGKGMWQRPDGSQYEGTWITGQKHGVGTQIFPNGARYRGEFAKGYEHGKGVRFQPDGSVFEGRFRFGKKDGPGVLTTADGQVERRNFKESEVFHERPVPEIVEVVADLDRKYFETASLMHLATAALARTMHKHRLLVPSALLHARLPEFMKPWVAHKYLETMFPKGSQEFLDAAPAVAFRSVEEINLKAVRFAHFDCESLLYFVAANRVLKRLYLSMNRLDAASLDMVSKRLFARSWPLLESLDLSFNRLDVSVVRNLINAVRNNPTIRVLKLGGCNINPNGAEIIAK